ncbi:MAG TPA: DUF4192 domain-containing protein [Aldersonia sp.]
MTTTADPFDPTASWQRPVRIGAPGDLLAALPAMLGFPPERSIVVACLGGDTGTALGAVMRHDLLVSRTRGLEPIMTAALDQFAAVAARERASGVIAAIVDDTAVCTRPRGSCDHRRRRRGCGRYLATRRHELVVAGLRTRLRRQSIHLLAVHVTAEVAAGQPWWSLRNDDRGGLLPDPSATAVAAAHVFEGRQIHGSRADVAAVIAPDETAQRAVAAELRALEQDPTAPERLLTRGGLELVLRAVAEFDPAAPPEFRRCAEIAVALRDRDVRDALIALSVGASAEDANALWAHLCRVLPAPDRAEPATLLGFGTYIRREGPLAGIAFAAALAADPPHRLARLLDSALQAGMRPDDMRDLADTGYRCAKRLGVILPPPLARTE